MSHARLAIARTSCIIHINGRQFWELDIEGIGENFDSKVVEKDPA
jgi:hypothetical protein